MSQADRLRASLAGEPVDRAPIACWRHWPGDDQHAGSFADSIIRDQREFDWDFVKVSPSSTHTVTPWGSEAAYQQPAQFGHIGERTYLRRAVPSLADWDQIQPLADLPSEWARQVEVVRTIKRELPDVPLLVSVFSPIATIRYMCGDDIFLTTLNNFQAQTRRLTGLITTSVTNYVAELCAAGADGIFYSTLATGSVSSWTQYQDQFLRADQEILEAAADKDLNIMHLHGPSPHLQLADQLPIAGANWDDRSTGPTLAQGLDRLRCGIIGGLAQTGSLLSAAPTEVAAEVTELVRRYPSRVVLGPGCAMPIGVPRGNLHAARDAVGQ